MPSSIVPDGIVRAALPLRRQTPRRGWRRCMMIRAYRYASPPRGYLDSGLSGSTPGSRCVAVNLPLESIQRVVACSTVIHGLCRSTVAVAAKPVRVCAGERRLDVAPLRSWNPQDSRMSRANPVPIRRSVRTLHHVSEASLAEACSGDGERAAAGWRPSIGAIRSPRRSVSATDLLVPAGMPKNDGGAPSRAWPEADESRSMASSYARASSRSITRTRQRVAPRGWLRRTGPLARKPAAAA